MTVTERLYALEAAAPIAVRPKLRWLMSKDVAEQLAKEAGVPPVFYRGTVMGYPYVVRDEYPPDTLIYDVVEPPPASDRPTAQLAITLPTGFTAGEAERVIIAVLREQERLRGRAI